LLLYAWLSRKSRRLVDAMEKSAVAFLNVWRTGAARAAGVGRRAGFGGRRRRQGPAATWVTLESSPEPEH